jgi:hypothetical protein
MAVIGTRSFSNANANRGIVGEKLKNHLKFNDFSGLKTLPHLIASAFVFYFVQTINLSPTVQQGVVLLDCC